MKNARLAAWTTALRTTAHSQGQGALCVEQEGTDHVCCLFILCEVARFDLGLRYQREGDSTVVAAPHQSFVRNLPPPAVARWLGATPDYQTDAGYTDIHLDWDADLRDRNDIPYDDDDCSTAAGLNDTFGLTFDQIADLFDHFGFR